MISPVVAWMMRILSPLISIRMGFGRGFARCRCSAAALRHLASYPGCPHAAGRADDSVAFAPPRHAAWPHLWAPTGDAHRRVELDHDRSTCAAMVRGKTSAPA